LDLDYCSIKSPITGAISDRKITVGNLISSSESSKPLTTVVSEDKMDVAFDVDENTLEKIQQAVRDGHIKLQKDGEIPAEAGLSLHGTTYPLHGLINFTDNRIDPKTGTIRMKARFDNAKPASGERLLADGMYMRVRVPIGEAVKSILVPDSAFGSDQGVKFLYIVGPDNKAQRLDAVTGNLEGDLRVVDSVRVPGEAKPRPLALTDRVIVTGLQRVRPGMVVDPKIAAPPKK
jgi:RND family efflux transporter MFP subunit